MSETKTIPILFSANLSATAEEYSKLSFEIQKQHIQQGYLIATLDTIELHFTLFNDLDAKNNQAMCFIRTEEVDAIYKLWQFAKIQNSGIPRLENIADKPWGMREFAFVDSNGNLIKVGKAIDAN